MAIVNQSVSEVLILTALGVVISGLGAAALTDFHGFRSGYIRRMVKYYESPRHQKLALVWTQKQKARMTDEVHWRRALFFPAALSVVMGAGILLLEVAALASGHVA